MAKFRKKPVVIEAVRFDIDTYNPVAFAAMVGLDPETFDPVFGSLDVVTLEGTMKLMPND
jgi:hypothetical protein